MDKKLTRLEKIEKIIAINFLIEQEELEKEGKTRSKPKIKPPYPGKEE